MTVDVAFSLLLAATQAVVLFLTIRLLREERKLLAPAFFAFAVACSLFSALYWLAYDLLQPETRMPFAANEICEWALFLLLASSLRASFPKSAPRPMALLLTALFACANAALWIGWSGEWVQDILTGLSLGYLLCVLVSCLLQSAALTRGEWIVLCVSAGLLIAAQTLTFFVRRAAAQGLSLGCSVLLLMVDAWLLVKAVCAFFCPPSEPATDCAESQIRTEKKTDCRSRSAASFRGGRQRALCFPFAVFAWSTLAMYMSSDWVYLAALLLAVLSYPLMLLALRREVRAA